MAKFKKCGSLLLSDTPNGSSEKSTLIAAVCPPSMNDPLGNYGSGVYPKAAALVLLYDNVFHIDNWVKFQVITKATEPFYIFSYPHTSATARHVTTDGYEDLCRIPRIKFKKINSHQVLAGGADKIRGIFRKVTQKSMFPKRFFNDADSVGTFTTDPTNRICWHFGVCPVKVNTLLPAVIVEFSADVGVTVQLFRRDEVTGT